MIDLDENQNEDFEIIPKKDIHSLREEIDSIKKNPLGDNESGSRLLNTMGNLNDSMTSMMSLFKVASQSMESEEREQEVIGKKIEPLFEKVDRVLDQNEKIAKALVAIADMIEELKNNKPEDPVGDLRKEAGMDSQVNNGIDNSMNMSPPQNNVQSPNFNQQPTQDNSFNLNNNNFGNDGMQGNFQQQPQFGGQPNVNMNSQPMSEPKNIPPPPSMGQQMGQQVNQQFKQMPGMPPPPIGRSKPQKEQKKPLFGFKK